MGFTSVDVTVADGEGSSTLTGAYLYVSDPTPSISAVVPAAGPFAGAMQGNHLETRDPDPDVAVQIMPRHPEEQEKHHGQSKDFHQLS